MSISKLLFGEIALKKKLVTKEQVEECLDIQRKLKDMGITKTLGAVMHDKKYLSMVEIKEILREMTGTKEWNAIEGYEILGKLGKGGMGSVYKARHQKLDKLVALKVLPPELASDQEYLDRFLREARAAAKLNHPNIVQALDVGESYGYHYFVMEYVEGKTVKDMIEHDGPLPEGRALDIIAQMSEALVHAWKHEMVHRDIKPSNIIVNEQGQAKLCDLGLAKSVSEDGTITQTGVIMGTPFYLSPEQARSEDLDCRSDLYSLGVTLFHMVTGQVPFSGNSAATILYKHIFLEPPKPKSLNPRISDGVSRLVVRMMSKSREERPQNPTALLDELVGLREAVGDGGGLAAPEPLRAPLRGAKQEDAITADFGPLDNTLVESGRAGDETSEQTGSIGGISGPNVAVRGPDDTIGGAEVTEQLTGKVARDLALPRRHKGGMRVRSRGLLAASVIGLVGLATLVALQATAPPAIPIETGPRAVRSALASGEKPRPEVAAATAQVEKMRVERRLPEAVQALRAVAPVSVADQMALAQARESLTADAAREFQRLKADFDKAATQAGPQADQARRAIQDLDLASVVQLAEAEKARLAAERTALEAPQAPSPER
jgi:serine/threonine-protein kinase